MLGTILIVCGFVSGGRSADVESQPFLGLLPERRFGFAPRRCGYFAVAWPDLVNVQADSQPRPCCSSRSSGSSANFGWSSSTALNYQPHEL